VEKRHKQLAKGLSMNLTNYQWETSRSDQYCLPFLFNIVLWLFFRFIELVFVYAGKEYKAVGVFYSLLLGFASFIIPLMEGL
jgi:hypothetical protein